MSGNQITTTSITPHPNWSDMLNPTSTNKKDQGTSHPNLTNSFISTSISAYDSAPKVSSNQQPGQPACNNLASLVLTVLVYQGKTKIDKQPSETKPQSTNEPDKSSKQTTTTQTKQNQ
jgi:hypothetical protein